MFKVKRGDVCNICNVKRANPEGRLKDKRLRKFVQEALENKWLEKILTLRDLKELEIRDSQIKHHYLAIVNSRG